MKMEGKEGRRKERREGKRKEGKPGKEGRGKEGKRKGGKAGKGKERGPSPYFVKGPLSSQLRHWARSCLRSKRLLELWWVFRPVDHLKAHLLHGSSTLASKSTATLFLSSSTKCRQQERATKSRRRHFLDFDIDASVDEPLNSLLVYRTHSDTPRSVVATPTPVP